MSSTCKVPPPHRAPAASVPLSVLLLALLTVAPVRAADIPEAGAGAPPAGKNLVTNTFFDTPLRQALADIAAQTGETIVPDLSVQGLVTAELYDVPLPRALDTVLASGNYEWKRMDGGYYLVGSTDPDSPSFNKLADTVRLKLTYANAASAIALLSDRQRKYVRADAESNVVVITAPPNLLKELEAQIRAVDTQPQQVVIEARVVELERQALNQFSASLNWQKNVSEDGAKGSVGHAFFEPLTWQLGLGYQTTAEFTRSLDLLLILLEENDSATIVANPRVVAMDGKAADIKVVTEQYFEILTEDVYVRSELEVIQSGIELHMVPKIGDDGLITMEVSPEVSNVVGQGAKGLPMITRRQASTTVHVQDGGTIVIAGLLDNRSRVVVQRVPILGSLPLIGYLFRSTNVEDSDRQMAILITPRIIGRREEGDGTAGAGPPRSAAAPVGREFRDELHSILAAKAHETQ